MAKRARNKNMKDKCDCGCDSGNHSWHHHRKMGGCAGYGLGVIGAAVYYISTATSFWMGVVGFLKALVWPAFLVYNALKFLGM